MFHNTVWVSMIFSCAGQERPYQLSQQILSSLWLISERSQQAGACDIESVNFEGLCPPLRCPWRTMTTSWVQRGEDSNGFRSKGSVSLFCGQSWVFCAQSRTTGINVKTFISQSSHYCQIWLICFCCQFSAESMQPTLTPFTYRFLGSF